MNDDIYGMYKNKTLVSGTEILTEKDDRYLPKNIYQNKSLIKNFTNHLEQNYLHLVLMNYIHATPEGELEKDPILLLNSIKYLMEDMKIDISSVDNAGNSVLHYLSELDYSKEQFTPILEYIISKKPKINHQNKDGNTPLHFSIMCNSYELSQKLITLKADITLKNKLLQTPLFFLALGVISDKQIKISKWILKKTKNINDTDIFGNTIAHYLIWNFQLEFMEEVLSDYGIDYAIENDTNENPFDLLEEIKLENLKFLLQNGFNIQNILDGKVTIHDMDLHNLDEDSEDKYKLFSSLNAIYANNDFDYKVFEKYIPYILDNEFYNLIDKEVQEAFIF